MATEKIIVQAEVNADTNEASQINSFLDGMQDDLRGIARETDRVTSKTEQLEQSQRQHKRAADSVVSSYRDFITLDISGALSSITQGIGTVMSANRNWALEVEKISAVTATSMENATALNVSLAQMGITGEEALSQLSSMQGRVIDHFEREKEIVKELAELDRQRMDILADIEKAEIDHFERITDLEKEISQVGKEEIANRLSQRDEALAELQKDQSEFLADARREEQRETERLSDIWQDRVKEYQRSVIDAMDNLNDKSKRARSFAEFQEIQRQGQKRLDEMRRNLGDERQEFETTAEREAAARREAVEEEKQAIAEKSAFIEQQTAKDLAIIQERNAERVADLQERIAEENEAWSEQQSSFMRGLEDLDRQQAEVQQNTGSLAFVMRSLGVDMRDSNGEMRDMVDIIFDMKQALDDMPASAEKAAIIADLGWEDLAVWVERGADATESMRIAQERNLIPLEETLNRIHDQNKMLADLQLQLIGTTEQFGLSTLAGDAFVWALGKAAEAGQILMDLLQQLDHIQELVIEKIKGGIGSIDDALGLEGGFSDFVTNLGGGLLGGDSVGSIGGPLDALLGLGEFGQSLIPVGNNDRGTLNVNINGPVNGVEDINTAIRQAISAYDGDRWGIGL